MDTSTQSALASQVRDTRRVPLGALAATPTATPRRDEGEFNSSI